ncbi:MAG: tRNA pseudouridine(55) synthase TruB, partial [Gammaproteobacteria bacterium]|nr:tRNA pseudouridine(55) synthase TruB [Gammaproteobacteria bacterium]
LKSFEGQIEQVPPMYSALKHEGRPLYEYARAGIEIERPARTVTIHQLDLVDWQSPNLTFEVHCSKGTYVRTLAEDIATALGSCAHLVALRRTAVEPFESSSMVTLEQLQEAREHGGLQEYLLPVDAGLLHWPRVELDIIQQGRFEHGNQFEYTPAGLNVERVRVYGPENNLLGLADLDPGGRLIPLKVFNL